KKPAVRRVDEVEDQRVRHRQLQLRPPRTSVRRPMQGERIAAGDESVPRVDKVKGLDGRPYPGALAGQDLLPVLGTVDRLEYPVRSRVPRIGRYFNRPSDRGVQEFVARKVARGDRGRALDLRGRNRSLRRLPGVEEIERRRADHD